MSGRGRGLRQFVVPRREAPNRFALPSVARDRDRDCPLNKLTRTVRWSRNPLDYASTSEVRGPAGRTSKPLNLQNHPLRSTGSARGCPIPRLPARPQPSSRRLGPYSEQPYSRPCAQCSTGSPLRISSRRWQSDSKSFCNDLWQFKGLRNRKPCVTPRFQSSFEHPDSVDAYSFQCDSYSRAYDLVF